MAGNPLSPREREVFDLVVGLETQERIAALLGISRSTVDTHIRHLAEKLVGKPVRGPTRLIVASVLAGALDEFGNVADAAKLQRITQSRRNDRGYVYVIRAADSGRLKIGFTKGSAEERVAQLQPGSPELLEVVACVPQTASVNERAIHAKFSSSRLHGEWFEPTPSLVSFVASLVE